MNRVDTHESSKCLVIFFWVTCSVKVCVEGRGGREINMLLSGCQ